MAGFFTADDFFSFWLRPGLKKIKKLSEFFHRELQLLLNRKKVYRTNLRYSKDFRSMPATYFFYANQVPKPKYYAGFRHKKSSGWGCRRAR